MRKILFFAPLAVFLVLIVMLGIKLETPAKMVSSPLLGKSFPVITLPGISKEDLGLDSSAFKGKPVLVNVFASWCASCAIEHPLLLELAASKRLPIYGINWKDTEAKAHAWLNERGNPYTAIGADKDGRIAIELGITGAPESWLIDKEGRVVYHLPGVLTAEILEQEILPRLETMQ